MAVLQSPEITTTEAGLDILTEARSSSPKSSLPAAHSLLTLHSAISNISPPQSPATTPRSIEANEYSSPSQSPSHVSNSPDEQVNLTSSTTSQLATTKSTAQLPVKTASSRLKLANDMHTSGPRSIYKAASQITPSNVDSQAPNPISAPSRRSEFWQTVLSFDCHYETPTPSNSGTIEKSSLETPYVEREQPPRRSNEVSEDCSVHLTEMKIVCELCGVRFRKQGHFNMHWRSVHVGVPSQSSSPETPPPCGPIESPVPVNSPSLRSATHNRGGGAHEPAVKQEASITLLELSTPKSSKSCVSVPSSPCRSPSLTPSSSTTPAASEGSANDLRGISKLPRVYGCPQCSAAFRRGSDRNRHMRMVHQKIRPFKCTMCDKNFGRKSFLEAHVKTVHQKLRPFPCNDCGKAFGQKSSLTRHYRKIHGREPDVLQGETI